MSKVTNGFRVFGCAPQIDAGLIDRARRLPVANISDMMNRMDAGGAGIFPIHWSKESKSMAGTALTVRTRPGDNLIVHKAIDMARPGDVILVDAGGDLTTATMGEIMALLAKTNGVEGFVIDGAVRDRYEITEMGMPMFARGITHRGPYKDGPGEVNVPIRIGGMVVNPGDLVVGDGDGTLSIPAADANQILAAGEAKLEAEMKELASIRESKVDRSWVDRLLNERGCVIYEGTYCDDSR
ncbi:RraA family protein [Aidingimonas halophila]|uniref:Putative 4-hydroxy-4-methyl-2-oxoglutarate aldolase n=1 Tax=Aidingimonas halophila TaxID=574349 RepID=A0A1H2X7V7_9GAMM|nr:RraA family protein [Aidingimonas halophila]GHC28275.1 methyltransferase [Aidingimonas halophila]SDW88905.1 Regulator of RNase E activity RraA [Aidingimonas halophila]